MRQSTDLRPDEVLRCREAAQRFLKEVKPRLITPAQFREKHPYRAFFPPRTVDARPRFVHCSLLEGARSLVYAQHALVMKWDWAEGCYVGLA